LGLANGIFIVDTHMHIQRHAVGFKKSGENPDYKLLHEGMHTITAYDNSPRGLYHMDRYGVNVSVLQTAYGMSDELDVEIMKKHPDRFVCICKDANTQHRAMRGEKEWTIEDLE